MVYGTPLVMGALAMLIGLICLLARTFKEGIFLLVAGGVLARWSRVHDFRPRPHRRERTFRVSPDAVESEARVFARDDIHRLIIKNGMTGDRALQSWSAVPAVVTSTAVATNLEQRARTADICYSLELETDGKAYMLAGGMDETTANGLLHDVCKILRFSTN